MNSDPAGDSLVSSMGDIAVVAIIVAIAVLVLAVVVGVLRAQVRRRRNS